MPDSNMAIRANTTKVAPMGHKKTAKAGKTIKAAIRVAGASRTTMTMVST